MESSNGGDDGGGDDGGGDDGGGGDGGGGGRSVVPSFLFLNMRLGRTRVLQIFLREFLLFSTISSLSD